MKHARFVHLHVHSQYSLLDGACRIPELLDLANHYLMPAIAITDHGNMFGAIEFYLQAMEKGIKPIIGCEVYIAPKSRFEKTSHGIQDAAYHLTILAKDEEGYKNLIKLVTKGYLEGFYYKPRIDKELLAQSARGLLGLSGCLKSELSHLLSTEQFKTALTILDEFKQIFGKNNFYIEIQNQNLKEQFKINQRAIECAKELQLPLVATNDVHYLRKEEAPAHEILLCIQTQTNIQDPHRMRFGSDEFYFKSPEEMEKHFQEVPEALSNTLVITEQCNLELDFKQIHLPHFSPPEGKTKFEYLQELCLEGLKERYPNPSPEVKQRLEYELQVIKQSGFVGYFLIVWDFVHYAKSKNIPVGPGRGSAAGSLVSYLLGITDIDPLKYGLLFERFLNPERISMPDMDIDFCYERRPEVIDYVVEKYGKENVAQIVTFGTMLARAVVRDVGRALNMPYGEVDKIAKLIPQDPGIDLKQAIKIEPQLEHLYKTDPQVQRLLETALSLEGLTRHVSTHAAGVVIAEKPLTEYIPLCKMGEGQIITGYAMEALEKIGLLKIDFLGLRTLTVINETLKIIQRSRNISLEINSIPMDDRETFQMLQRGETLGVFQLESAGMRELLKRIKPERFEDIIAILALFRPGPIGSGMIEDFIKRKRGEVSVRYDHKKLEPILKETYGTILYQEQVMRIASEIGGFSMAEADVLRRAMSKKNPEAMDRARKSFLEGAKKNGIDPEVAHKIFNQIEYFAGYGFNKSHSAAYALISYRTAYLKANFTPEFMTALLTSERDNTEKVVQYINECARLNIQVLPPDINESFANFTLVSPQTIRFGLTAIKNVGQIAVEEIVRARREKGPFQNLYDFCERVDLRTVNHKVIESMIKCGAFDRFGLKRAQLMAILDDAIEVANSLQKDRTAKQFTIFELSSTPQFRKGYKPIPNIKEWPESQLLNFEKELLGFYVTGHPLARYEEFIRTYSRIRITELNRLKEGEEVFLCGMISRFKKTTTRRENELMSIVTLEDLSGEVETLVFPEVHKKFEKFIYNHSCIFLHGKLSLREDSPRIIATELFPIEEARRRFTKTIVLNIVRGLLDEDLEALRNIFKANPGKTKVVFEFRDHSGKTWLNLGKEFTVELNDNLIQGIEKILGKENIKYIPLFTLNHNRNNLT
ncbi:MAG: DNA polymerase III subunit alpha [Candidatus Omnitrophica bacterium]|nr:DNA polymerase III subunit alpha [Candidatus Omnitrophota bacterium]MCM8797968.1 DNA polymerase III subunit alpha [Candidatus Omnitrophota bacterium]